MADDNLNQGAAADASLSSGHPGSASYPSDIALLAHLAPDVRERFVSFMKELDIESEKRGFPYGKASLWQMTGAECWFDFFEDGLSAADALDEDESNW